MNFTQIFPDVCYFFFTCSTKVTIFVTRYTHDIRVFLQFDTGNEKNQIMSRKAQFLGGPFNHYIVLLEDLFSDQILFRHQGIKEYWNHVQRNIFDRPTQRHIRPRHKFLAQKHLRKNVKTIFAFKNWNSYLKILWFASSNLYILS